MNKFSRLFAFISLIAICAGMFSSVQPVSSAGIRQPEKSKRIPDVLLISLKANVTLEDNAGGNSNRKFKTNSIELDRVLFSLEAHSIKPLFPLGKVKQDAAHPELERVYQVKLKKNADLDAALAALSAVADVDYVEPDFYAQVSQDPTPAVVNDPRYPEQWGLTAIGAPEVWAEMPADALNVKVAVIDSGICADHPDLVGRISAGWDFLESDDIPQDESGHGCSVSGIIAANLNNEIGIAGVAPNAQVVPLRVLDADGVGSYSDVATAIVYAADHGAQVVNLSLGGENPSTVLENAVNYAISKGVILIAAAGNGGMESVLYPAAYPDVIAVGSIDPDWQRSAFSNYGPQVDVWAPGSDVLTTTSDGAYGLVSGTSFAAPYAAGMQVLNIALGHSSVQSRGDLPSFTPIDTTPSPTPTGILSAQAGTEVTIVPRDYSFNWSTSGANITSQNDVICSSNNADETRVLYWRTTDTGGWVEWRPTITSAGYYDIYVYIPDYTHTASITQIAKYYLNGSTLVGTIDQNQGKCSWKLMSTRYMSPNDYIRMPTYTGEDPFRLIAADGMKFVWSSSNQYTISGNAGTPNATITYTGGSATADSSGNYSFIVNYGWSGTVTPSKTGYTFSPASRSYSNVTANQSSQNYTLLIYPLTVTKSGTGSGTVTSSPSGISCGTDCTENYIYNTSVTLTATPASSSNFAGWGGACSGTGSCVVSVTSAKSVTATFTLKTYPLTVTQLGTGSGTVTSSPAGISCGADCTENYNYNTSVTLTATPASNSDFTGWGGACTGTGSCVISVTSAQSVTATFALKTYPLTATNSGSGSGTVISSPTGIDCGVDCTENYSHNTSVTLTATPASDSDFTGWGGACTGTGSCMVSVTSAQSVIATFTLKTYPLTVTNSGSGSGTVTSSPTGIDCGADCTENYSHNTSVILTATPASDSDFTGWGGACTGTGSCMVSVTSAQSVTATFTLKTYSLTVSKSGTGSGTVTSSLAGISCGADCTETYDYNTSVTLTAISASDSDFAGWSGACTGTGACTVTMTAAKSVTANFTLNTYSLSVTKSGDGSGVVTSSPAGINCGADCSEVYGHGTTVTLTATSDAGSRFVRWSGACQGTGSCLISMTANQSVEAIFEDLPVVSSITCNSSLPTNGSIVDFTVTFSEAVTGVNEFDFSIPPAVAPDDLEGAEVFSSGEDVGVTRTITVLTGTGSGPLTLNLIDDDTIVDENGNPLGGVGPGNGNFYGEACIIDRRTPTVTVEQSANQYDPTTALPIEFDIKFSEPIRGFTFTDSDVVVGGTAGATTAVVTEVAPHDKTTFTATVNQQNGRNPMMGYGTVTASISANKVLDLAGNLNLASISNDNEVIYHEADLACGDIPLIATGQDHTGILHFPEDVDVYKFEVANPFTTIFASLTPLAEGNFDLYLYHDCRPDDWGRGKRSIVKGIGGTDPVPGSTPDPDIELYYNVRNEIQSGTTYYLAVHIANGGTYGPAPLSYELNVTLTPSNVNLTNLTDTDGDALYDEWETMGVCIGGIFNGNLCEGGVFLDLPAMGADPWCKDIFVELDYMADGLHSHRPDPRAIAMVVEAFANAPVDNDPQCNRGKGITLHVDYGPDTIMNPYGLNGPTMWGEALSQSNSLDHDDDLGYAWMVGEYQRYSWDEFDAIKQANFSAARKSVFHYGVFAHDLGDLGDISGVSRDFGASDFIVSLGSWWINAPEDNEPQINPCEIQSIPENECIGKISQQAGTFMHELGHNLGLLHGGSDYLQYKPNHLSVMNYGFQTRGVPNSKANPFDYSRFELPTLNENNLNEAAGFNGGNLLIGYGTSHYCPDESYRIVKNANGPIDWNCDGNASGSVQVDVNGNNESTDTLTGYNEWSNLHYAGGSIGAFGSALPVSQTIVEELSHAEDARIPRHYPDSDGDGRKDLIDPCPFDATETCNYSIGKIARISISPNGTEGNGHSALSSPYANSISNDGRYVAFWSNAANLVSGDTNNKEDIFVRDLETKVTTRISLAIGGNEANGGSWHPAISGDGRYVAFYSLATNLVSNDTNGLQDIFVRDRQINATTLVSVASNGTQANGSSQDLSISANGRYVVFASTASNLVANDVNNKMDVFIRDVQTNVTSRVSVASDGMEGNGVSRYPSVSADGRYVVFNSSASNLVDDDINGVDDIFVRDLQTNTTMRISVNSDNVQGNAFSRIPSISADGRYVVFESWASNLVSDDSNGETDVFLRDLQSNTTTRVSVNAGGIEGNDFSYFPSVSALGRYVTFYSNSSNLVDNDANGGPDIFVRNMQSNAIARFSIASNGTEGNNTTGLMYNSSISANGRYIAFYSYANTLVEDDANNVADIFVSDTLAQNSYTISGNAGIANALIIYDGGTTIAGGNGDYAFTVPSGWSGTVTPSLAGYAFTPAYKTYVNIVSDQLNQDFIDVDTIPPTVVSSLRMDTNPTNAASVNFIVTFSEPVTGVNKTDFGLWGGNLISTSVTSVSGSGATYILTVNAGTGSGSLRLLVKDDNSIKDAAGNPLNSILVNDTYTGGEYYTVDRTPPIAVLIKRMSANPTNVVSVDFAVTFSKAVMNVSSLDFVLTGTGKNGASIASLSGSGSAYAVTVNTGEAGTLGLDLIDRGMIVDAVGNSLAGVADGGISGELYNVDKTFPTVVSSLRANPDPTNAASAQFTVTFSESVTGVDKWDFGLWAGTLTGTSITSVSGSGATYTVTANTGTGNGTLRLIVKDNNSVKDGAGNLLNGASNPTHVTGQYYTLDRTPPTAVSITRASANPTQAASVDFTVTFSETVMNVSSLDFVLTGTGASSASITGVSGSGKTYTVTVNTGFNGTLGLDLIDRDTILDTAGNPLAGATNGGISGPLYDVSKVTPFVLSSVRADANPTGAATVNFTVTFSEAVTGVNKTDFGLWSGTLSGTSVAGVSGSGTTYTVTVNAGTGSGSLRLIVKDDNTIKNAAGDPLNGAGSNPTYTAGEAYTVSR